MTPEPESWLDRAHAALRDAGLRLGGGREQVMGELSSEDCLLSAQDLADRLRGRPRAVSLATIYRTLEVLHALGLLARLDGADGVARYERAEPGVPRHHHSVCERCGRVLAFSDPALDAAIADVGRRLPFEVQHHELVLRGACDQCATRRATAAQPSDTGP